MTRLLLVCALMLAVVGMHHVTHSPHDITGHETVAVAAGTPELAPEGGHGAGHDLLHLCLAVLFTGVTLVALLLLASRGPADEAPRRPILATGRWQPPRLSGRSLLTSVCVMRT